MTAVLAPNHPEFESPVEEVYCFICFPALNEDESIAKVGKVLGEAALRLHHLKQFSIFDGNEARTGNAEVDVAMDDIRTSGQHLRTSKTPLPSLTHLRDRNGT